MSVFSSHTNSPLDLFYFIQKRLFLADTLSLCLLVQTTRQNKLRAKHSVVSNNRWLTASLWRESKTWGSRRPTWLSWPDTWANSIRSVSSPGPRLEWQTAQCLVCFKLNFLFLVNLNCRTARWPVAPESWRVMERLRCRAPTPPPARSSRLQNSTTALSKTRSAVHWWSKVWRHSLHLLSFLSF